MNVIAIDIGNTNIGIGLYLDDKEQFIKSIPGKSEAKLASCLKSAGGLFKMISVKKCTSSAKRYPCR
jgi:pantothenate kinase type III